MLGIGSKIDEASPYCVKQCESFHFTRKLHKSISTLSLNLFINCNGVISNGGRQQNSNLKFGISGHNCMRNILSSTPHMY